MTFDVAKAVESMGKATEKGFSLAEEFKKKTIGNGCNQINKTKNESH